jgi:uncharacterized protein (TIGR03084 family)
VELTTLTEVVADLAEEQRILDELLAGLSEEQWSTPTLAEGWDIRDTVGHLADTDDMMFASTTGESDSNLADLADRLEVPGEISERAGDVSPEDRVDEFTAWQVARVRKIPPLEVYAWWRSASARNRDQIASYDPSKKYAWGGNQLSPLSLASARLMETWAHSLDIHGGLGRDLPDTDRLRHIAHLGLRALPYAFNLVGATPPGAVRMELKSPTGDKWRLGPDDAPTVIRGSAGDWCRLVARRDRDGSAARLQAEGPDAANVIKHGRAFL